MTDAHPGRLLPACLHQAISDEIPMRLEFYESWLQPDRLLDGSIGLAPLTAVIGFLRTEGAAYERVMSRAGTLAAEWALAAMPGYERRLSRGLPSGLRFRLALRAARRIIREVMASNRAASNVRRGRATLRVERSIFCQVRERQAAPLCGFYRALVDATLQAFGIQAASRIESCHAISSGSPCVLLFDVTRREESAEPARAA
jgi:hypothetical protein